MDETIEIKVTSEMAGKRLDVVLSEQCSDLTRSYINKLCKEERAALNGKTSKGNKKCKEGDVITLQVPEPTELEILPEEMNLDIVYEDQDVILINKPKGMVVHPAAGHYSGTLVNGLMAHCKDDLSGINGVLRPGIVHRIDKDTTGILIVCKNDMAHQSIAKQLYDHSITRKYHAIVYGNIKEEEGTVNAPIGRSLKDRKKMGIVMDGKHAVTHYKVLKRLKKGFTYIECQLETGRTHQIRVHMAHIGHPLWGDKLYGRGGQVLTPPVPGVLLKHDPAPRQMLHAWHLSFIHPFTGEKMAFTCPPPEDFVQTALTLERHMRRVVVTGVAGSGKSLFMRMLAEEGVPTWSADAAVIRLYEPGREAWQALRLRYGDRFIPDDRSPVDRKALAAALLPSAESGVDVHELENLLHPLVLDDLERFWSGQEEAGRGYAVAEVPLWFESGWSRKLCGERRPYVVGISCEQGERCRRLLEVRGWSDTLMARMDGLQWTQERKLAGCDKVIANSGTEGALRDKARAFVRVMEHWDAESRAAFLGQWEHLVNEPCPEAG